MPNFKGRHEKNETETVSTEAAEDQRAKRVRPLHTSHTHTLHTKDDIDHRTALKILLSAESTQTLQPNLADAETLARLLSTISTFRAGK